MATKVKPSRLQVSGTPQVGQVPVYVDEDTFQWGAGGGGGGGCAMWGCITGTLCNQTDLQGALDCKADCSAIPTDNCQLANGCGYTTCTGDAINACVVHIAGGETITGQKTFTQPTKIQSGDATGALIIGANLNSSVVSANNRKMARVGMPSFDTCAPVTIISGDSQNSAVNLVDFGGNPLATGSAAPDFIRFVVAKTHGSTCGDKINMFEVSNYEGADVNFLQHKKGISLNAKTMLSDDAIPTAGDCGCLVPSTSWVQGELGSYAKCTDIPTDNCQLANGCDYATCCYVNDSINSVTAYYITKNAQGDQFATYAELAAATTFYSGGVVRIPTKNDYTIVLADENHDNATTRYIYNSGWEYQYTVNETALTQAQLDAINSGITAAKVTCYDSCYAQCCDIPTDNCQLSNGCGYTTCTGTLVASDLTPYAQTSCIACINGCCLTNGGDITISGGITNDTTGTTTTVAKIWAGTEAEYGDLATKDEHTIYYVF